MSFQRLRIDMHFSAPNFCVLSHEVAEMVDPKMCRFWSSCRQGFNHRTAGLRVSLVGLPPEESYPTPAVAGEGIHYPWV